MTTINAGTLLVNGSIGNGAVSVGATGTLGGGGTITGATSFISGGALQPGPTAGSSSGILTFGGALDLTFATTSLQLFGAGGVAGTDFDKLVVNGALAWGGSLAIVSANSYNAYAANGTYPLVAVGPSPSGNLQSLTLDGTALARNGSVWSGLVNGATCTFDQSTGVLTITPPLPIPPVITVQPTSVSVPVGGSATFTVAATGVQTYQWRKDGNAIPGATAASLSLGNALSANAGNYDVVLTNNYGSTTSATATLTLTPALPAVTVQPVATSGAVGQQLTLVIAATGAESYQWRKNGVSIAGATGSTLTLTNTQAADSGSYDVVLTNAFGSTASTTATVSVLGKFTFVAAGSVQLFYADATAIAFAWTLDGVAAGSTSAFSYQPDTFDVGNHWIVVDQTDASGAHTIREWAVRVTIPLPATSAANYYVSPYGSDVNAGTLAAPFLTLEAARNAVRALPKPLPDGGVTIWLRGGTHYRNTTFALTSADSGTAAAPIVYRAYPGETPVISAGKPQLASAFAPLAASEAARVAPGIDPASIVELDLAAAGIVNRNAFPAAFDQWTTYNAYKTNSDGGICEVIFNGKRMFLSRYPNHDLTNDNLNTTNLLMDGVVAGTATDGTGYLNGDGTYTDSTGAAVTVGGAFKYKAGDAAHVARWSTAFAKGGVWLQGYWRVPWQINAAKVKGIDATNRVIELDPSGEVSGGIGSKYARPVGSLAEPYWVLNLLEELDQPGEWAIDFSRGKLYFLPPTAITDNSLEISDLAAPIIQINGGSYTYFRGITFQNGLASGVQILNGTRNLVLGCVFKNMNNYPVDLNGGSANGVVSCDMSDLGGGGVLLQGGNETSTPRVAAHHFVVNNRITNFSAVTKIYTSAVDAGYAGAGGGSGGGGHVQSVGMRVANNRISVSSHGAVLHGSFDHTFEYNDLSDFCQISDDLGGFYCYDTFGRMGNSTFRYNFIHDSPRGDGIYFDNDHWSMHLYGNVMNLRTLASESRGIGVVYKIGTQATAGSQQTIECFDNITVNAHLGFDFWVTLPSIVEENASILVSPTPFKWTKINIGAGGNTSSNSTAAALQSGPNVTYTSDPGFLDLANNDLRLKPTAPLFADMPKFTAAPFELIGVYNDEYRSDATTARTPYVASGTATNITTNSATLTGVLAYPQFEANATVTVYWGTADGGTDANVWQHSLSLGLNAAGSLQTALTGLVPGTNYFFRFLAINSAGSKWAESGANFTTLAPPAFTSAATAAGTFGTPFSFAVTASGSPAPVFTATGLPAGLGLNAATGAITGTTAAGTYVVSLIASNSSGSANATLNLTIAKAPATIVLSALTQTYTGAPLTVIASTTPANLPLTLTYAGTATTPTNAGTYSVAATITDPNYSGLTSGTFTITPASLVITLGNLAQSFDGTPRVVTAATAPSGIAVALSYSGGPTAPANAGTYPVTAISANPNYVGSAAGTLVVSKAAAGVALSGLNQTYDGSPRGVTVTTSPANLAVAVTYAGASTPPTVPGTYAIAATVIDSNYLGSAQDTLVVVPGTATITLSNLAQTYDGSLKTVTVATLPAALAVDVIYDGSSTPPVNAGTYAITATVHDSNYAASATGSLIIAKATAALTLDGLAQTYDGTPKLATVTTAPTSLAVLFSYDGIPAALLPSSGATLAPYAAALGQTIYVQATGTLSGAVIGTGPYEITSDIGAAAVQAGVLIPGQSAVLQIQIAADQSPYSAGTQNGVASTAASSGGGSFQIVGIAASGFTLGPVSAGNVAVTATVVDANYDGSANATLTIAKATPAIAWPTPASIAFGTALGATQLNATSSTAGTFIYSPAAGTVLHAGVNQPLAAAFTPGDTANFNSASVGTVITVTVGAATPAIANLSQTYDGSPKPVSVTTTPAGLAMQVTYGGAATPPTNAGSYGVTATITDPDYSGSASALLTIARASASVGLSNLSQIYNGASHPVTVSTSPAGLPVSVAYNGSATAPINAGSYPVSAVITSSNYTGSTSGVLTVTKATATLTLGQLVQNYDGTSKSITTVTNPAGLSVNVTYDGTTTAPIYPGPHPVVATVSDANYAASESDTLTIVAAALVRHAPTLNGLVDGSVQVLLPESLTLNSNASVSGDLLVPGVPALQLNGHPTFVGTRDGLGLATPTNYAVTLNGNAVLRYLVRQVDAIAMPVVTTPPSPSGSRSVSINSTGQSPGDFGTLRDLTLNSNVGSVAIPPGTYGNFTANSGSGFVLGIAGATTPAVYNFQNFTLNGGSSLQIVGPVCLTLANGVNLNASAGNATHPKWLTLLIANGGVTLNGNVSLQGSVVAPAGTVTINGSSTLVGTVIADRLTINGNGLLDQTTP